ATASSAPDGELPVTGVAAEGDGEQHDVADGVAGTISVAHQPAPTIEDLAELLVELVRDMVGDVVEPVWDSGWLTSFSHDPGTLETLRPVLAATHYNPTVNERFTSLSVVAPDRLPTPPPPPGRVAASDVFDAAVPVLIDDVGVVSQSLRSPVPGLLIRAGSPQAGSLLGNWIADVTVGRCRLPAHPRAAAAAEVDEAMVSEGLVRVGRTGTSWVAVSDRRVPGDVDVHHALNPVTLYDPDLPRLLDAVLPDGWTWQLSDAGRYYQGFTERAGGLPALLELLRDPVTNSVLRAFRTTNARGRQLGLELKDRRRYLSFGDLLAAATSATSATSQPAPGTASAVTAGELVERIRQTVDVLVRGDMLTRGLVVKCDRCRHGSFQPLADLGRTFRCPRCDHHGVLDSTTWLPPETTGPIWHYRLDELVRHAVEENVEGPALTLAAVGADHPSARHMWSIELWKDGEQACELDFVMLVDGTLRTGEVKTNGRLGRTRKERGAEVRKTMAGARLLGATDVVFATTKPQWEATSVEAIRAVTGRVGGPIIWQLDGLQ
ncbi:MAG: hypothetical protein ACRDWY_04990, partial [Actinomycetes bacterium]